MSVLPDNYECPVDSVIIKASSIVAPLFKQTCHTANLITLEGAFLSGYGLYSLYNYSLPSFMIYYALGYAFDCLDGHFARRYNMTSKFGEYFEHTKDIVTSAAFAYIFYSRYTVPLYMWGLFAFFGSGLLVHMGHQQFYIKSKNHFLDFLQPLCKNVSNLKYTRFLGCGTFMLFSIFAPSFCKRRFMI